MVEGSPVILDNYQVLKLEISIAAIWQGPEIIFNDLGLGYLMASTYFKREFLVEIQVLLNTKTWS